MDKFELTCKEFQIPCEKIYKDGLRTRVNFALYRNNEKIYYAMFENGKITIEFNTDFICESIENMMPNVLKKLPKNYQEKLFEIRFFSTSSSMNILFLYHKNISDLDPKILYDVLTNLTDLKLNIVLQARNQRKCYPNDILEHFSNGIKYKFNDECFIQPSLIMNENMLNFAKKCLENKPCDDLLELYCGYGNFTLVLAKYFNKVLATELSKKNIMFLKNNCELNKIKNVDIARLRDDEVVMAMNKVREFNRLKNINLDEYNFSHIMLDPPRSGLGSSIELAKRIDNIIYISCNPNSAKEDLKILEKTHKLLKFELFDQFINSNHLECGFYLEKR
ncbi:tRNA (uridine(54)-C5)-methyltransferase TrmA [Campylobacter sp. MG1]|uniref:tRNA (uridine(54)-C5)-methyltransferase TrmA n=1 Tax=Campylobacter sp. MG1 TaxID=2976332 RepID=UPI00226CDBEC|nr:tRNA (uridine(54)-C5)-methyltransferase TrmA [Campylobacter sp. MG1]